MAGPVTLQLDGVDMKLDFELHLRVDVSSNVRRLSEVGLHTSPFSFSYRLRLLNAFHCSISLDRPSLVRKIRPSPPHQE
jgi:hypothetical protein